MSIRSRLGRWWDNRVCDWMDYEDRHPQRAAAISVTLMIAQGVTLLVLIGLVALR